MWHPRVAIVTPGTFPIPSGASSSVERVVEYVSSFAAYRMDIRIYGKLCKGQEPFSEIRGVPCERVHAANERVYIRNVLSRVSSYKPDIVQIENRPQFVHRVRAVLPHTQVWLNLHSTTFLQSKHMKRRALRSALNAVDRIQVNSQYIFDHLTRIEPKLAAKIIINPLGVDSSCFISRFSEAGMQRVRAERERRDWNNRHVILYVGRLIPLKGVHHLLRAVGSVVRRMPSALFVIVGGASYGRSRKTAYVRRLEAIGRRYPNHVRFLPYTAHEEIPMLYAGADVVVVPSVEREAFGLVNVEAMATGIPVVATRVGGIQEVVADQVTGVLLSRQQLSTRLADVLVLLLNHTEYAEKLGRAGVERTAALYTWERTAERWADAVCEGFVSNKTNE